jgi:hypothetical protein
MKLRYDCLPPFDHGFCGYLGYMATIRTVDKRKFEVEVSARKADEEIVRVGGRAVPIVDLKVAGEDRIVYINASHIVSIEDD